jgi:hypothetical protein
MYNAAKVRIGGTEALVPVPGVDTATAHAAALDALQIKHEAALAAMQAKIEAAAQAQAEALAEEVRARTHLAEQVAELTSELGDQRDRTAELELRHALRNGEPIVPPVETQRVQPVPVVPASEVVPSGRTHHIGELFNQKLSFSNPNRVFDAMLVLKSGTQDQLAVHGALWEVIFKDKDLTAHLLNLEPKKMVMHEGSYEWYARKIPGGKEIDLSVLLEKKDNQYVIDLVNDSAKRRGASQRVATALDVIKEGFINRMSTNGAGAFDVIIGKK